MVLMSMPMSMSILSLKLEFENVLMSMLIVNPGFDIRTLVAVKFHDSSA